ncbi:unnamed protein product [Ranitomeya imitator]|uniref:Chromo domain-containing protein n=1 Tax=Ranitomeya imitator TaxID=111125 RepID=A0ABN9KTS4_9NEOB|nr:unnamed protein product [Ranitomeya imitator]
MVHLVPLSKLPSSSDLVPLFFQHVVRLHGIPENIVSDRGSQFVSRSLLRRYVAPVVPSIDPPAPVLVEGELEYIVEKILDSRVSKWKLQYLVKWKGYGQEDNSWVFASDVHAADLVRAFHVAHPGRPGGSVIICGGLPFPLGNFSEARYKNNVPINDQFHSEKYKIESEYGLHSLEIFKCDFEDTAQYHASAMNVKGESSSYASLVVKRYKGELDVIPLTPPRSEPFSFSVTPYGFATKFDIHFVDSFGVSFGKEGETLSLGSTVIVHPTIKRFQPEIQWYRNGVLVTPSKWLSTHWSGGHAMLTLRHLNKEDEGLYTLRVVMGEYYDQYSAYVFVRGEKRISNMSLCFYIYFWMYYRLYDHFDFRINGDHGSRTPSDHKVIPYPIDKR